MANYSEMTLPAATVIKERAPGFTPRLGLILGSGLGALAEQIVASIIIPFAELPGFPLSTVQGHAGRLLLGTLNGLPVACYQGRVHGYEQTTAEQFKIFIRTLKLIGCEQLLITNSAGSLQPSMGPGSIVLISDHINLQPGNPLVGDNDEAFGPRFFAMDNAYDPALRQRFQQQAQQLNLPLHEGVYLGVIGPCFETPAEIRAFRTLGADVIGMSTVPEVIVARHCGLRVVALSIITNLAAGMTAESLSHEGTLHYAELAINNLTPLIMNVLGSLAHDPC